MTTLLAVCVLIIVSISLWGVGSAIQRVAASREFPWPVSIGVGLAATVGAGGFLNLAHLARRPELWALAGLETFLAVLELRRIRWKLDYPAKDAVEIVSAAFAIGVVTLFAIVTQLPPRTFNSHDDFEKYLAYPVRMLATGTLTGSPLSALGSEAFGGQTFLHGIVLSFLPIDYVNGVDAVFCLMALMFVAASAGWKKFSWFPGAILGPLLIAAINPQYVNVSSLYSGALLMATAVMLARGGEKAGIPSPLVLGLLYGSLLALKPTFVLFVVCHLAFLLLVPRLERWSPVAAAAWCGRSLAWTAFFVCPWILLHIRNYIGGGPQAKIPVPAGLDDHLHLFSAANLFYGASFLHFTAIALAAAAVAAVSLAVSRSKADPDVRKVALGTLAGAASGAVCYFVTVAALGRAFGHAQSLRLAIPFLLGACVTSIAMSPAIAKDRTTHPFFYFPLLASLAICAAFAPSMAARYTQAARSGSILAFSDLAQSPAYEAYNRYCLSAQARRYILAFQAKVPAGEPLLVWINTPFLLDYNRNAIIDVDTVGLASPWAHVPGGVRYVLWQYQGPEVRRTGDYLQAMQGPGYRERMVASGSLDFATHLSQAAQASDVIATDGEFVLFKAHGAL